jgi:hypothetical protein
LGSAFDPKFTGYEQTFNEINPKIISQTLLLQQYQINRRLPNTICTDKDCKARRQVDCRRRWAEASEIDESEFFNMHRL